MQFETIDALFAFSLVSTLLVCMLFWVGIGADVPYPCSNHHCCSWATRPKASRERGRRRWVEDNVPSCGTAQLARCGSWTATRRLSKS
jgi:hypothetical protein